MPYFVKLQGEGLVDLTRASAPTWGVAGRHGRPAGRSGATRIVNAGRLRIKDRSDRLAMKPADRCAERAGSRCGGA